MAALRTGSVALILIAAGWLWLMPEKGSAQAPWMVDRKIAADLRESGVAKETEHAVLYFEAGTLSDDDMTEFAGLVDKGIVDIATYLRVTPPAAPDGKIRYYITSQAGISHSMGRSVFLPIERVQRKAAPYLHETTHVIAPCDDCPMWFSEGLASYVQSYVSEHIGGYDGVIFARQGNRGIDRDSSRWLANDRGQAVLPFIGKEEQPPRINYDRSNVAAPYYVMAQSLVKYMVECMDMDTLRVVMGAADFERVLQIETGKNSEQWKEEWLNRLQNPAP